MVGTSKVHTAKKEYRCDAGLLCVKSDPNNEIIPGDRYVDETIPPWTMYQDDPEGSPIPLGEWVHHRFHVECYGPEVWS